MTRRCLAVAVLFVITSFAQADHEVARTYVNTLTPIADPKPLLADHPEFVESIRETRRLEAPILVDDDGADLSVRAWRYSYNARAIIEIPNRLRSSATAVIVVHPWGIDDGQGWKTPEPAGVCDFCTPEKNHLSHEHIVQVLNPFLVSMRPEVGLTAYSLIGPEDPIRKKLYRSIRRRPTKQEREEGARELTAKLASFRYEGEGLPQTFSISTQNPVRDYFKHFPGLDAGAKYNNAGFWELPVPVVKGIDVHEEDVLFYDPEGYEPIRDFLKQEGIRHVLLTGYATDMCFCRTPAGYENLSKDFNVFLVGDATLATFPASSTPRFATSAHLSFASLTQLVTQISWIRPDVAKSPKKDAVNKAVPGNEPRR